MALLLSLLALHSAAAATTARAASLPKSFTGTLTDVETAAPLTETTTTAYGTFHQTFSGYTVTYKFTGLVFRPNAQGLYTMAHGYLSTNGFEVTQTAPAGQTDGGCVAHYMFKPSGSPTGNIGGFSETDGKWQATVSLGVTMVAAGKGGVKATGCGPKLASTSNIYGVPPRIGVEIIATGSYDPSTQKLTFDSTVPDPATSDQGRQSHKVDGTLR